MYEYTNSFQNYIVLGAWVNLTSKHFQSLLFMDAKTVVGSKSKHLIQVYFNRTETINEGLN